MPYEWLPPDGDRQRLHLWPHRSLTQRGFVWFVGATAALIAVPLLSLVGSPTLWALLPFLIGAVWAIWYALRRNGRDRDIVEDLTLCRDQVTLVRHEPGGAQRSWQANPYWVRVTLHRSGGPVPQYLTLKGDGREVEIGAFLSEEERIALKDELQRALDRARQP